jgi:hypothetical protein
LHGRQEEAVGVELAMDKGALAVLSSFDLPASKLLDKLLETTLELEIALGLESSTVQASGVRSHA